MLKLSALFCLSVIFMLNGAQAKLVQIIHTNDLHSHFTPNEKKLGGYSRIKTLINELKMDAEKQNIPSLVLDAGDFGEGSSYFYSNEGVDAFIALDKLGIDVTVLGNHDYMFGGDDLRRQIINSNLQTKLISANLKGKKKMGLDNLIPDSVDFNLDGMKIRIFGLTTPELHFQYPLRPQGRIAKSHKVGIQQARLAERDGMDFVITLSHSGLKRDTILAQNTRTVDLIVGGHDHILMTQPKMVENLEGELVPILQVGAHGMNIGSLFVDLLGNGEFKIISYTVYDVTNNIPEDQDLAEFVKTAQINREKFFNRSWDEVIGFSEIALTGQVDGLFRNTHSCWSKHLARMTRVAGQTELGMQVDSFQGIQIEPGPITFGNIIDNFPHNQDWSNKGWSITRGRIGGLMLKLLIKTLRNADTPIITTIDGLQAYQGEDLAPVQFNPHEHDARQAMINGKFLKPFKGYTISMPSEVPMALRKISPILAKIIMQGIEDTEKFYWPLIEDYIKSYSPLKCD